MTNETNSMTIDTSKLRELALAATPGARQERKCISGCVQSQSAMYSNSSI